VCLKYESDSGVCAARVGTARSFLRLATSSVCSVQLESVKALLYTTSSLLALVANAPVHGDTVQRRIDDAGCASVPLG
jgi:hypothetical protein